MHPFEQNPGAPGQQHTTRGQRRVPAVIYARAALGEADIAHQIAACTSGAMPLVERPGFCALVDECAAKHGLTRLLVSEPDRIARGFKLDLRPETLLRKLRVIAVSGPVGWMAAFDMSDLGHFDRLRTEGGA